MKKYFIIFGLLYCVSLSFAQDKVVKGIKGVTRSESTILQGGVHLTGPLGKAVQNAVTISQIKVPGVVAETSASQSQQIPQSVDETLRQAQSVVQNNAEIQPQTPTPPSQERYISPFAMFWSDEPEPSSSAWSRSETPHHWANTVANRRAAASSGHSLEEVEAECLAKGMLPQLIDLIPPTERLARLNEWLTVYNSSTKGGTGPLRYKDVIADGNLVASEVEGDEITQIRLQSEFQSVQANYINDFYQGPFNPKITYMRILAVNDMEEYIAPLQQAARQNRHVTVNIAPTVEAAREALEEAFERHDPYDIVLLDYHGLQGSAADLSKWIHKNTYLSVPVVFYSASRSMPEILFKFNIVGSIPIAPTVEEAHQVLNYASHLVR